VNTVNHLRDPLSGVKRLAAFSSRHGRIALGQSSFLPDMLFAWDARLERSINDAVRAYYRDRYSLSERDLAKTRRLVGLLREAGLRGIQARTTVIERVPSRDHTERMLLSSGAPVTRQADDGVIRFTVGNTDELELEGVDIPGDLSSAAFLIAAAVLVRGSRLVLSGVGVNWTRTGFLRILERMGAIVLGDVEPPGSFAAEEPVADLDVSFGPLEGTVVEGDEVPLAIDELPLVALLGCFAEGETVVRGAGELRVKESDRIATVVDGLRGLGASIEATEDGFAVAHQQDLRLER